MLSKNFFSKTLNTVSILAISGALLGAIVTTPSRAMEDPDTTPHGLLAKKQTNLTAEQWDALRGFFYDMLPEMDKRLSIKTRAAVMQVNKHAYTILSRDPGISKKWKGAQIWEVPHQDDVPWRHSLYGSLFFKYFDQTNDNSLEVMEDPILLKENERLCHLYLERACVFGDSKAWRKKHYGTLEGLWGYTKDKAAADNILNIWAEKEAKWVVSLLSDSCNNKRVELRNTIKSKALAKGRRWAIISYSRAIECDNRYNPTSTDQFYALRTTLATLVAEGYTFAKQIKFDQLINGGLYFYKNMSEAHELLYQAVGNKEEWAMEAKYEGLTKEKYGLKKNPAKAGELLEAGYGLGQSWALAEKFSNLDKEPMKRHAFIEEHLNNKWAKQKKYKDLRAGDNGYERNYTAALAFLLNTFGVTQEEFAALQ